MKSSDFPAAQRAASSVSASAQRRYYALLSMQLGSGFLGAALAAASVAVETAAARHWLLQGSAAALLVSFVAMLVGRALRYDARWWDARAVAESVRSQAWRYMMRAVPFDGADGPSQEKGFLAGVAETLRARPAILAALEGRRGGDLDEITEVMRSTRAAPLDQRQTTYGDERVNDQRRWYGDKARFHDRAREAYFVVATLAQLAAVIVAFVQWRPFKLNIVPLLVALSASVTAWSQAKRHEESAQAYALARQELDLMMRRVIAAATEETFGVAVTETEAAVSREHTMWMARRNR